MGHALLVKLLTPLLGKTAATLTSPKEVRVVVVASEAHKYVPKEGIHLDRMKSDGRPLTAIDLYSESKLANVLYGQELAHQFAGQFTVVPIDPGHFATGLYASKGAGLFVSLLGVMVRFIGTSIREAGKNYLWAATSSDVTSGEYYRPVGVGGDGGPFTKDDALRRRLWEWTEKELEGHVL
jgi:NAD(P)-dependent dehydrogenase (short-subunit alcohol dehydrogenase family)